MGGSPQVQASAQNPKRNSHILVSGIGPVPQKWNCEVHPHPPRTMSLLDRLGLHRRERGSRPRNVLAVDRAIMGDIRRRQW